MTDEERRKRIDEARAEAAQRRADPATPRMAFWLSFVDPDRPAGQRFLGGCLVDDVVNAADAIEQSHRRQCNPGGEVAMAEVSLDDIPAGYPRNELLSMERLKALGPVEKMP